MLLNTSHPLYSNLKFLFGVDETNALVDLVTPTRTFTAHANSIIGTGTYGRHFGARRSGATTTYGAAISPVFQPANNTGTIVVVTNGIPYAAASSNATIIGAPDNAPRLLPRIGNTTAGTGAAASVRNIGTGSTNISSLTTTPFVGATARMWAFTRDSVTSHALYVDGVQEVSGGAIGSDGSSGLWSYIGGTSGFSTIEADIVWIAWFDIALTTTQVSDLYASLGANNTFALVEGGTPPDPTPPTGTVTIGTITPSTTSALVPYTYSAGDATGYQYRLDGGVAATLGASPATISGLTATTPYSIEIRATNADGEGAWSTAANFTTSASGDAEPPTLTGVVTFTSVTQTSYTANWPAGLDNVAVTGYEYQIGSTAGAWTDVGNNLSAAITGRTAGATETVYVRNYDAAGFRSTPAISGEVTLESIPASGINITEPLKNNTDTVLANLSGVGVAILSVSDFTYGLTTNGSGILSTISGAGITAGQQYHVAIKLADGGVGITGPITAS